MGGATIEQLHMSNLARILQNYGAVISRDQRREKLLRALQPFLFDGTECHRVVNAELRGPENEITASNIRHAIVSQYCNCVPIDCVVEVITGLLDRGELV
jgi:hypothetical protein